MTFQHRYDHRNDETSMNFNSKAHWNQINVEIEQFSTECRKVIRKYFGIA